MALDMVFYIYGLLGSCFLLSVKKYGYKIQSELSTPNKRNFEQFLVHWLDAWVVQAACWMNQVKECKQKFETTIGEEVGVGNHVES